MESIEKLREYMQDMRKRSVTPGHNPCADEVDDYLDEIEREIAERYMELPVDADGVPWHIGDVTENGNIVNAICFDRHGCHFQDTLNDIDPSIHRHIKPDPVKELLEEYYSKRSDDALDESACSGLHREEAIKCVRRDVAALIDEYAARIRKAVSA